MQAHGEYYLKNKSSAIKRRPVLIQRAFLNKLQLIGSILRIPVSPSGGPIGRSHGTSEGGGRKEGVHACKVGSGQRRRTGGRQKVGSSRKERTGQSGSSRSSQRNSTFAFCLGLDLGRSGNGVITGAIHTGTSMHQVITELRHVIHVIS